MMRYASVLGCCLLASLPAAPAAAQPAFEGVITATSYAEGQTAEVVFRLKDGKLRMELVEDGERGVLIVDGTGSVISVDDAERVFYVLPPPPDEGDSMPDLEPLGRGETVAGHPCRYYRYPLSADSGHYVEACIAEGLGYMSWQRAELSSPAEERRLRRQFPGGAMILKGLEPGGSIAFIVTRIERLPVPDALFAPPAGYRAVRLPHRDD